MGNRPDIETRLDELYAGPPDEFTRARDELVAELKEEGSKEAAAELKRRRRPTKAASVVNRLARADPDALEEVVEAGRALRELQAGSGDDVGARLREAAERQRTAIDRLLELARTELEVSGATLDRVEETLRATVDEGVAAEVSAGRLEREQRAVGLAGGLPSGGGGGGKRHRKRSKSESKRLERAKRQLAERERRVERARADEAEARSRRERAERALAESSAAYEASQDELAAAEEELNERRIEVRDLEQRAAAEE